MSGRYRLTSSAPSEIAAPYWFDDVDEAIANTSSGYPDVYDEEVGVWLSAGPEDYADALDNLVDKGKLSAEKRDAEIAALKKRGYLTERAS
jgi:hypothetical protein